MATSSIKIDSTIENGNVTRVQTFTEDTEACKAKEDTEACKVKEDIENICWGDDVIVGHNGLNDGKSNNDEDIKDVRYRLSDLHFTYDDNGSGDSNQAKTAADSTASHCLSQSVTIDGNKMCFQTDKLTTYQQSSELDEPSSSGVTLTDATGCKDVRCEHCRKEDLAGGPNHITATRKTKAEKKRLRLAYVLEKRKLGRRDEKLRKRERLKEEREKDQDANSERRSKREEIEAIRSRLTEGLNSGWRLCVDLGMESVMSSKEKSKLAQQLCRLYGVNRKSQYPAHLYFAGLDEDGELYRECVRKNSGFKDYKVDMTGEAVTELFPLDEMVYLSPDAEEELSSLSEEDVYVLGGLVDESIAKNTTKDKADHNQIRMAKLPIDQYMDKVEQASHSQVLAVNQVFEILMTYKETGDWREALKAGMPKRKGYVLKESVS